MNRIAFIIEETFLYWSSIVVTLAGVSAILMFLSLTLGEKDDRAAGMAAVPLAGGLSLIFSRLVHWYCHPVGYASLTAALTDYRNGGYALIGVFFGCILAALLLRLLRVSGNLPRMLDHMAIAGSLGIALGRLASLFNNSDRGMLLSAEVPFPLASAVVNSVSGATENRLAVFMLQAMVAAVLFVVLWIFYTRGRRKGTLRDGDTCLIFLLCYCAAQALLDSPRYDNLYFRSNGFVSVVQIFSALTVAAAAIIVTVRLIRSRGGKWGLMALPLLPLLGIAGYMEYHVQRHGDQAAFAYTVMGLCLGCFVLLTLLMRSLAARAEP